MKKIVAFQANNGKIFLSEKACKEYENKLIGFPKVTKTETMIAPKVFKYVIHTQKKPRGKVVQEIYFIINSIWKVYFKQWHDHSWILNYLGEDTLKANPHFVEPWFFAVCRNLLNCKNNKGVIDNFSTIQNTIKETHSSCRFCMTEENEKFTFYDAQWLSGHASMVQMIVEKIIK